MAVNRSGSVLAADFGSVRTRALLIDLVDGMYRMVARAETPTTAGFPVQDLRVGLNRALQALSEATGRNFLSPNGAILSPEQPDRSGVDFFIMTASLGRPLRTVLVGLVPDVSVASGRRATAGTYVDVVETLTLADMRSEEEQLNAILLGHPDLIFITGGTEFGAETPLLRLVEVVRLALLVTDERQRAAVLFAGNSKLSARIQEMFKGITEVLVSPNVRPSLEAEQLESAQIQLALAFNRQKAKGGEGFEDLNTLSRLGVLPTANSYNLAVDFLGRTHPRGVLALDIGSAVSTLAVSLGGKVSTSIRTDIGLGHSASALLNLVSTDAVQRWLPFNAAHREILNYAANKTLRPAVLPQTLRDLYLEYALLRAGGQALIQAARPAWNENARSKTRAALPDFNVVIGAGGALTRTGSPGLNTLLLLDTVQPTGVTLLQSDPFGLLAVLGPLALVNPEAAVQILEGSNFEKLGTVVSLSGLPRTGKPALTVAVKLPDGSTGTHTVDGGDLWFYPILAGQKVQVTINVVQRGLSIGGKTRLKITMEGGSLGIIFDARGRPLPLAAQARQRAQQMPLWMSQMTGDALRPIDESWLEAVEEAEEAVPARRSKAPKPDKRKAPKAEKEMAAAPEAPPAADDQDLLRSMLDESQPKRPKGRGKK